MFCFFGGGLLLRMVEGGFYGGAGLGLLLTGVCESSLGILYKFGVFSRLPQSGNPRLPINSIAQPVLSILYLVRQPSPNLNPCAAASGILLPILISLLIFLILARLTSIRGESRSPRYVEKTYVRGSVGKAYGCCLE